MISKCKKNYKLVVAFILGIIVSGVVVYAATIESSNISYDNSTSGLKSTTLKGVIDELYEKVPKKNQNYTMGTTVFAGGNFYTQCGINNTSFSCNDNLYTWDRKTAKARMITYQEVADLGCSYGDSCANWLKTSSSYYWTMNGSSGAGVAIGSGGLYQDGGTAYTMSYGIRAVVIVSK